jgi:hypothetical protein
VSTPLPPAPDARACSGAGAGGAAAGGATTGGAATGGATAETDTAAGQGAEPAGNAFPDLVPPEILARPFRHELRWIERDLAAVEIDRHLRRLARHEALARLLLGRLARPLLKRRLHDELGFVRLGDYGRERLGLSARELQSAAQVAAALENLPAVAEAFTGGAISWTQARLLAAVASPATDSAWLARARGRTVRALEAAIRAARGGVDVAGAGDDAGALGETPESHRPSASDAIPASRGAGAASDASARPPSPSCEAALEECDEEGRLVEGEPEVRFLLPCPLWVRARWRETVELARRVAGEQLPVWQAAEAIAAEGLSWRAATAVGTAAPPGAPPTPSISPPRPGGTTEAPDPAEVGAAFAWIDWRAVEAALPDDLEALGEGVDGLDARTLDRRLRTAVRALGRVDWQTGRLLRLLFDLRLYTLLGFRSAGQYVRERLGICTRKARMLVAVERRTWDSPALMDAYSTGTLSWVQALTILPVVRESPRSAAAWVARAAEVTVRRLADEIAWALERRDAAGTYWLPVEPPPPGAVLDRPERQTRAPGDLAPLDAAIAFSGPASVVALFRDALAAFREPGMPAWRACELLLAHAREEWTRQPRHRDPVFARDGWRCAVPGCSARRNLHDHHLRFRSQGGDNARANRITICAAHHLRGIHRGVVRAGGRAPDAVRWALGVRPDRAPFMELLGDRYLGREGGGSGAAT